MAAEVPVADVDIAFEQSRQERPLDLFGRAEDDRGNPLGRGPILGALIEQGFEQDHQRPGADDEVLRVRVFVRKTRQLKSKELTDELLVPVAEPDVAA